MKRDFKGIWIPKEIWLSKELTLQEKVFLVEIDSLNQEFGCFASNDYFAEFFGLSKVRVSNVIGSLIKKGFITSEIIPEEGNKRIIKTSYQKLYEGHKGNFKRGHKGNFKHNNTDDNNTLNNTSIVLPFETDSFKNLWDQWKKYRQSKHSFEYDPYSEQAALYNLSRKSGGSENEAADLIRTSMARGWKDFFTSQKNDNYDRESELEKAGREYLAGR